MIDNPEILDLLAKYFNQPEDLYLKSKVDSFRSQSTQNETFFKELEKVCLLSERSKLLDSVDDRAAMQRFKKRLSIIPKVSSNKTVKFTFVRWMAAAAVVLIVASIFYLYKDVDMLTGSKVRQYAADALPGNNKAVLVLADGRKVSLSDISNGDVAKEAGLSITKTADGELVYTIAENTNGNDNDNNAVNTIETPRGGMWQIKLPDGSKVWLNAASSLTYPLSFAKGEKRVVTLNGEAYFEVAEDKTHPFLVKTTKQEVEVLGTHFNINSYTDEVAVKTTLLEGSVKVSTYLDGEHEVLKPGEQSILTNKGFEIKQVDAEEAIDWKNGYFKFNNDKQESIMRKIARWYNVQIEYADASAKEVTYYGSVSRFDHISKILRKFEQTGEVRFEIEKNKVIVYKE